MHLVWVYPDELELGGRGYSMTACASCCRRAEFGWVAADALMPLPGDLLCYVKDGNTWRIAGFFGGLPPASRCANVGAGARLRRRTNVAPIPGTISAYTCVLDARLQHEVLRFADPPAGRSLQRATPPW